MGNPVTSRIVAAGLALLAAGGTIYAARVSVAQVLYHEAKYGVARNHADGILRRVQRIHRLYPRHYLACALAASRAYREARRQPARQTELERIADFWCRESLVLNPYKRNMRLLRARLMARENPKAAAAYWDSYVNWSFWDPFNHYMRAEFQAYAGDYVKAMDALAWTEGSPYYAKARAKIRNAFDAERAAPP